MDSLLNRASIPADCVEYAIHLPGNAVASRAESTCALIHRFVYSYIQSYIWQKDAFNLRVVDASTLCGSTHFGDCIDDEWYITFLLVEISKNFDDTIVSVSDSDGEFLLIEAANVLPRWLDPANATNRVWIHAGKLCIIGQDIKEPEIATAMNLVRSGKAYADDEINTVALGPTREYPQKATSHIHNARAIIPIELAYILDQQPQLISYAIEAFYLRDPIALKACYRMQKFPPTKTTSTVVKMTRTLYAQTVGQRFQPPKAFKMPSPSSGDYNAADIGMKITCGFEMFMAQHREAKEKKAEDDPQWSMFLANLTRLGYFGSDIVGSRRYNELRDSAKEQFLRNRKVTQGSVDLGIIASRIEALRTHVPDDWMPLNKLKEDNEDWLNVDEESLRAALDGRGMDIDKQDDLEQEDELQLNKMVSKFDQFVANEDAGIEGVEMDDEIDDEMDDEIDSQDEDSSENGEDKTLPTLWKESHDNESWGQKQKIAPREPEPYDSDVESDSSLNIDMKDFIEFSRQALGLSEEQFRDILKDREAQGKPMVVYDMPKRHPEEDILLASKENVKTFTEHEPATKSTHDPSLDSFEAVMDAMDAELAKTQNLQRGFDKREKSSDAKNKGKGPAQPLRSLSMDASNEVVSDVESDSSDDVEMDYNLLKNMLESVKGQAGGPFDGPAGNLMGRMGLKLP